MDFGIALAIGLISEAIKALNEWQQSINWGDFFAVIVIGGVALWVLFSFTAEGALVIVGAYIVLIISALFAGVFKK